MIILQTIPQSNVLVGLGLNKKLLSMVNKSSNVAKSVLGGSAYKKPIKFM